MLNGLEDLVKKHDLRIEAACLFVACIGLGVSMLLMGPNSHIDAVTDFLHLSAIVPSKTANIIAGAAFLTTAFFAVLTLFTKKAWQILGWLLIALSLLPLASLLSSSRWIDSLGGFPAIGSGQGIIKYAALLSLGVTYLYRERLNAFQLQVINMLPIVLVLVWIGGMKFTAIEAKGIEDLVATSPLMSWMYAIWDVQTTSNIIGVYDLVAVLLLMLSLKYRFLMWPGILMAGSVFVTTQTFLLSFPGSLSEDTLLASSGQFIIKDLWYLANLSVIISVATAWRLPRRAA